MDEKKRIAIVCGGRSTEHQISLLSAQNVYKSLDKNKYEAILIGIDKQGLWHYNEASETLLATSDPSTISIDSISHPVLFSQNNNEKEIVSKETNQVIARIDVIFPVLHGMFGEDGSIQGLAKLANIPCVGCGILGSSVGMDKDIMKRILRDANIRVAKWVTIRHSSEGVDYDKIVEELGNELFIKPVNLGSSVGVAYSNDERSFYQGLDNALKYDTKVIIEEKITSREIECAVLGNADPQASIPGEIVPRGGFYSFQNKYLDETGAELLIPAKLSEDQISRIQSLATKVFILLEARGMARVDMFLTPEDDIIINEINTIPGFTNISMYPKLWEISGLTQTQLITRLIELAEEEHTLQNKLLLN